MGKKQLQTSNGMVVIATTREKNEEEKPAATDDFLFVAQSSESIEYACGHSGPRKFVINLYGQIREPNDEFFVERKMCPVCFIDSLRKVTIRCGVCGNAIFPGEPVAAYANNDSFNPKWLTLTPNGSVIGCLRMDCCPSGGFFAGHWSGERFESAFSGGLSAAETVFQTGKTIMKTDL